MTEEKAEVIAALERMRSEWKPRYMIGDTLLRKILEVLKDEKEADD